MIQVTMLCACKASLHDMYMIPKQTLHRHKLFTSILNEIRHSILMKSRLHVIKEVFVHSSRYIVNAYFQLDNAYKRTTNLRDFAS